MDSYWTDLFYAGAHKYLFEVGYRTTDHGCTHVFNPETDELEPIIGFEERMIQGYAVSRVQTGCDRWYDLDGSTLLARRID